MKTIKKKNVKIIINLFQCDNNTLKIGSGDVDDLSKLSFLNEENIIAELRARYRKGQIYVSEKLKIKKKN